MASKVLLVLTNHSELGNSGKKTGWSLPEVAYTYDALKKNNYHVDFVSPRGGQAPIDPDSLQKFENDPVCKQFWSDTKIRDLIEHTKSANDIKDAKDYCGIFFAGGHGPLFDVANCKELCKFTGELWEKCGGIAGGICHGPVGFLNATLSNGEHFVKGKKITAFTNAEDTAMGADKYIPLKIEDELKKRGAIFVGGPEGKSHVECAERLVTGQNPASSKELAECFCKMLNEKGKPEKA